MGLSLTKPAAKKRVVQRPPGPSRVRHTARGCRQYECAAADNESYQENTLFMMMYECAGRWSAMNSANSRAPACKALTRDPRFAKLRRKYNGAVTSTRPYLTKPDPAYECRLGDDYRRPGCQALLKTVHPGFARRRWT